MVSSRARVCQSATEPFNLQTPTVDPALKATQAAYTYAANDPLNEVDPSGLCAFETGKGGGGKRPGKQTAPDLSEEEQEAVDAKEAGLPYDRAAYNRAMRKLGTGQKYGGSRNEAKRKGNNRSAFSSDSNSSTSGASDGFTADDFQIAADVALATVVVAVVVVAVVALPVEAVAAAGAAVATAVVGGLADLFSW